jgi:hypothetical protein
MPEYIYSVLYADIKWRIQKVNNAIIAILPHCRGLSAAGRNRKPETE